MTRFVEWIQITLLLFAGVLILGAVVCLVIAGVYLFDSWRHLRRIS